MSAIWVLFVSVFIGCVFLGSGGVFLLVSVWCLLVRWCVCVCVSRLLLWCLGGSVCVVSVVVSVSQVVCVLVGCCCLGGGVCRAPKGQ